jgi:hypothetical protein
MNILIKEIWQIIINGLNFVDQVSVCLISKYFMINHPVTNLFDSGCKLTDKISKSYLYVTELFVCNNSKITNVNHMKNLRILHAEGHCGINDTGINQLVLLSELHAMLVTLNLSNIESYTKNSPFLK